MRLTQGQGGGDEVLDDFFKVVRRDGRGMLCSETRPGEGEGRDGRLMCVCVRSGGVGAAAE